MNRYIVPSLLLAGSVVAAGCTEDPRAPTSVELRPSEHFVGRQPRPATLPLPTGFQPEGITTGRGDDFYVGASLLGAIYKGSVRTGEGAILVPPAPGSRMILGLAYDGRSGLLFAAGGPLGAAHVFDATTGAVAATYQLATPCDPPCTLINDVVVTRSAAYFTDSFRPVLYRVPLGPHGRLPDPSEVGPVPLTGDFQMTTLALPGAGAPINANGIDVTPNGKYLIVVNFTLGTLYRVDPRTGTAVEIDLDGDALPYGDGILLDGRDLYVVQNALNQVAVVHLRGHYTAGSVQRIVTDPRFRIPTSIAAFGDALYALNARLDVAPPFVPSPDVEFEIVRVPLPESVHHDVPHERRRHRRDDDRRR
jgi:sugar lactone lactonase YvrE